MGCRHDRGPDLYPETVEERDALRGEEVAIVGSSEERGSGAWATWVAFAGVMLMLIGVFSVIAGLAAAFEDDYFIKGPFDGEVLVLSTQALGLIWIALGILKVMTGYALIQGREWARVVTVILCFLNAIANFAALGAQPFLSIVLIALNVTVIYAVTVKWEQAKIGMGD